MNIGLIPSRYAKALWEYAQEQHATESLYEEMGRLAASFSQEPTLRSALTNPVLSSAQKSDLARNAAGGSVSEAFTRFIALVLDHKREGLLHLMALDYLLLYRKAHNISTGKLVTAVAVSEATAQRLKEWIIARTHGSLELQTLTRPELLGGFVFEMNSLRLDASLSSQLRSIRQQFIANNQRIV